MGSSTVSVKKKMVAQHYRNILVQFTLPWFCWTLDNICIGSFVGGGRIRLDEHGSRTSVLLLEIPFPCPRCCTIVPRSRKALAACATSGFVRSRTALATRSAGRNSPGKQNVLIIPSGGRTVLVPVSRECDPAKEGDGGNFWVVFCFFLNSLSLDPCFRSRLNVIPMHCLWHGRVAFCDRSGNDKIPRIWEFVVLT